MNDPQALAQAFERHRRYLFGLCYRMCGTGADAEDLVQETFERALKHPPEGAADDLKPWLVRVAMNASRDHLRRRRRQGYVGPWLPGPLETPPDAPELQGSEGPDARYGRLESLSLAFMCALEALTPRQRAVLLLRDVFDFSVRETAEAAELSESNVKTTLHRARAALAEYDAARSPLTAESQARALRALQAFLVHVMTGNQEALRALLRDDVVMHNDGAGEFFAAQKPVVGFEKVATFHRKTRRLGLARARFVVLNGLPALVIDSPSSEARLARRLVAWVQLDAQGKIARIDWQMATRKLPVALFDSLSLPGPGLWLQALRAALLTPAPRAWLLPAARRLLGRVPLSP
jgi:RNA polymerase sigma factor (sigma-70 family)